MLREELLKYHVFYCGRGQEIIYQGFKRNATMQKKKKKKKGILPPSRVTEITTFNSWYLSYKSMLNLQI